MRLIRKGTVVSVFLLVIVTSSFVFAGSRDYTASALFPAVWLLPDMKECVTPGKDFAEVKIGRPWDFNKKGDLQGFKCSAEAKTSDGKLCFKTTGEPMTISWGAQTGQVSRPLYVP